jgi:hypothetical protein
MSRKRFVWACILALAAWSSLGAAHAAPVKARAARGPASEAGTAPTGAVPTITPEELTRLLKRLAAAPGCNGGSCTTSSGLGLTCPASGGPSCDEEDVCLCECAQRTNGSWSTNNACVPVWEL